jgi:adenosylcobyric acid synthase
MTARGLLVCGTASNAGKTTIVAALCRSLARRGVRVAPFKAQNMSLNSGVTASGHEIARAQLLQADAARVAAEVAMNPILVKPGTDRSAHLVVNGVPAGEIDAGDYVGDRSALRQLATDAYRDLAARYELVIAEGAGSAAEINLRAQDIANLGLAQAVDIPVVLVTDIDRGGAFASLIGTMECLDAYDRSRVVGFVINRFRGDPTILKSGIDELERRTGRPVFGVLPYDPELRLDAEDSLATDWAPRPKPPIGADVLRVAVVRFPRASNLTDLEPLAAEPGVVLTFADVPQQLVDAELVVLPGTRTTVADLEWLRATGFAETLQHRASRGRPILGICGGYQMLGRHIDDNVESTSGEVAGLGLLPVRTTFSADKVVAQRSVRLSDGVEVTGYQIHHGRAERLSGERLFADEGCRVGAVAGTTWHGLFDSDGYRRQLLSWVAAATGRQFVSSNHDWYAERDRQLDRLAAAVDLHLSALVDQLWRTGRARSES